MDYTSESDLKCINEKEVKLGMEEKEQNSDHEMKCVEKSERKLTDVTGSIKTEEEEQNLDHEMKCVEESEGKLISTSRKVEESGERLLIRKSMINHLLINDQVLFKSSESKDDELDNQQKSEIAEELLDRDYGLFLAKFGNHLLKEHLSYFENRSEEESLIVDLYLKQLHKVIEQKNCRMQLTKEKNKIPAVEEMELALEFSPAEKARRSIRSKLLDHLSLSKDAHFKSQQVGEPDLDQWEKREIAEKLLGHSPSMFLARFGTHLLEEHLVYFDSGLPGEESYEVEYHLKQLRKTHCKAVSQVGIKNRRFEALKKLLEEGSYFSETEMRNRNPLLYEQLVGRFLTADERRARLNNIDTTNITFVNLLLEQMDRENVKKLKKEQEEAEDDAMEEEDTSDDQIEDDDTDSEEDNKLDKTLWGEGYSDSHVSATKNISTKKEAKKTQEKINEDEHPEVSDTEKRLLMEEFRTNMFSSFLQGKDISFDYSQVDYNPDYDDLEVQGQDEEEEYFDKESPQDASSNKMSDEEDLLDQYMNGLKADPTPLQLADQLHTLSHKDN